MNKALLKTCNKVLARNLGTISIGSLGKPSDVLSLHPSNLANRSLSHGEVKVSLKTSAVLLEDIRKINGTSLVNRNLGVCGIVGSGIVSSVAADVHDLAVNDTVLVFGEGTWSDEIVVSRTGVAKLTNIKCDIAASLPSYISAWAVLHNYVSLKAGDIVVQSNGNCGVGKAISQVGQALGFNVVSINDSELGDSKVWTKLKESGGSIKLAVTGQSGRHINSLLRSTSKGGALVAYNGIYEPLNATSEVHLPVSSLVFNENNVFGFDFQAWAQHDKAAYNKALSSVLSLIATKKITLVPSKVYPQNEYLKAIDEVIKNGTVAVLQH